MEKNSFCEPIGYYMDFSKAIDYSFVVSKIQRILRGTKDFIKEVLLRIVD